MIDFSTVTDIMLGNQQVTQIEDSLGNVLWSGGQEDNTEYFYIVNTYSSTNRVMIKKSNADAPDITVYYSTNKSTWTLMGTTSTTNITYTIPVNGRVYLKANAPNGWGFRNSAGGTQSNIITTQRTATIGGNLKSLIFGDNYRKLSNHIPNYAFLGLFSRATKITSAINLQLVEDILTPYCYSSMFYGCTSLTTAPATLPATTLAEGCYQRMFDGCTSLTTAPALPATTLAQSCYQGMFNGCTSLTTAPALPATTLTEGCYGNMFYNCTALTTAPALPATTLAQSCYQGMFYGCTKLTTAPALPATTLTYGCYQQMFRGCEALVTAPALPATTLAESCYYNMFNGCTALQTAPQLPATTLVKNCYFGMLANCTALTQAPVLPATTLTLYCYYNMFSGCTNLNKVTTYAQDISANYCLSNWLNGVAAQGEFYNLGSATYSSGASGIPTGWTVHTSL